MRWTTKYIRRIGAQKAAAASDPRYALSMTTALTDDQRAQLAAAIAMVRVADRDRFQDLVVALLDHGLDLTVAIKMLTGIRPVS
jgi:hypothetical protein